jgi:hypothetical protein
MRLEELGKLQKLNDLIDNSTRDLPSGAQIKKTKLRGLSPRANYTDR